MSEFPTVGIGILNWNGRQYLQQFLHCLYSITYPNVKLYVIDNNSTDDSIAYLQEQHPSVTIIQTGANLGFAGGYNIGFGQMPEPYLLMLNSDVELTPGFLEPLVALMERRERLAMCQSKILSYHSRQQFEHGGAAGGMLDILGYSFCRGRIFDTVENDADQYETAPVFWAGGACSLVRKSAYQAVSGMYEYFFMHFEEIDLCWRLQAAGYSIMCSNESVVYHVGGGTLSYQSPRKTRFNFRNNLVMYYRNTPWWDKIWWLPVRALLDQAAVINYLFKQDPKNALAVYQGYGGFLQWLFAVKKPTVKKVKRSALPCLYNGSILWQYFVKKNREYSAIRKD